MSPACPLEAPISRRARSGPLDAADRGHLAACPSCRAALKLTVALVELAAADERREGEAHAGDLPSAAQVYLRAELRRRRERAEAARARAERVAGLGSALGLSATLSGLAFAAILTLAAALSGNAGEAIAWTLTASSAVALVLACGWALRDA